MYGVVLEPAVWGCGGRVIAVAFLEPRAMGTCLVLGQARGLDQQVSLVSHSSVLGGIKLTGTVQVQERAAECLLPWPFFTEKASISTVS